MRCLPCFLMVGLVASLLMEAGASTRSARAEEMAPVRVMSFNLRYGTARDGDNHWEKRKDFLVETVRAFDPDLLGTQETLNFQRDYLITHLSGYDVVGVGRNDGTDTGEMTTVFYKRERFEKLDSGHFWLSETPEVVGSESWDTSLPRMASWVKLKDKTAPEAAPIVFLNTHFDHRGSEARRQSAKLIRSKVETLGAGCAIVVTGDFNADANTPPYNALFGEVDGKPSVVVDTYRVAHPEKQPGEGTFSAWSPKPNDGGRIDWIAVSREWTVESASIDRTGRGGRTPSDHFPITAVLKRSAK